MSAPYIALIPARLASSRFPEKMLADLAGKPLIVRTAERASLSQACAVYVAADDSRIAAPVEAHGFKVLMTRVDHQSGTERLAEAADLLGLPDEAVIVNVQGDEPLIDPALIDAVAQMLQCNENLVMASACHAISTTDDLFNPNVVKVVLDHAANALYFSRAPIPWARDAFAGQDSPPPQSALPAALPVMRHIGIYGYRAGFLRQYQRLSPCAMEQFEALEQLRVLWHGYKIGMAVVEHAPEAGVDTPADLDRTRARWQALYG
ncbi:3-deoxy-manno-octulosonate cytidylyltransferase [Burkholderiaceae bacterium DAT-1]|nr:3-deoxy-manno-octulosonate cytidylyltransferase [Burkholderiaceae bacterium DAT-1]